MRRSSKVALLTAVALIAAEGLARLAFVFPLYGADSEVGYWPLPDQHGAFLFKNDWAFDHESLGVAEEYEPSAKSDVLLVGDSIVYGGNMLRQADKLGPLMETSTGWQVWPAGAGSWGLQNELAFLRRKPELVQGADVIVFVANSGDFEKPSEWRSPYSHPREYPQLYLPYLFNRYVRKPPADPAPFPVAQRDVLADWQAFVRSAGKPVYVIAYSTAEETGRACDWVPPDFLKQASWACYDGFATLGAGGFVDGVHPTAAANHVLANAVLRYLKSQEPLLRN